MLLPTSRPSLPLLGAALWLAAAPALADAENLVEPRNRLVGSTWTVGRYNPLGFDQQVTMTFKQRIGDSDDILFKTRSWQVGVMGGWNPANWSARAEAMVEPIAFFQLRAAYDVRGFFGGLGAIYSGPGPDLDITRPAVAAAEAQEYAGIVQGITLEPALQAAFGPIVIRNTFGIEYASWSVRAGDAVVYDPGPDIARPARGWTLTETGTVGYLNGHLFAGAQYIWINPVGLPRQQHKVAALAAWTFYDRGAEHGWFNKPTVLAVAIFSLVHGGLAPFPPTMVVGLSTESDFLGGMAAPALKP
ncbi:MAG TPA: hypothetical protein VIG99_28665 [Myxococcaceae bacterium]|jgi:hypothetical protein